MALGVGIINALRPRLENLHLRVLIGRNDPYFAESVENNQRLLCRLELSWNPIAISIF